MVNALMNLQDPTPKAPDNPAKPVDASVILRGLQESVVATSDIGPSLEEPIITLSAISLPPEGARLQEPIVIGCHSFSSKGVPSGADHHFIGRYCSFSRTGMFCH
jgi:hypothetical protein